MLNAPSIRSQAAAAVAKPDRLGGQPRPPPRPLHGVAHLCGHAPNDLLLAGMPTHCGARRARHLVAQAPTKAAARPLAASGRLAHDAVADAAPPGTARAARPRLS
eukprot:1974768-Prymnesium_polylepis.1